MIAAVAVGALLLLAVGILGFRALYPDTPGPPPSTADPTTSDPSPTAEPTPAQTTSPGTPGSQGTTGTVSEFDLNVGQCLDEYELGAPEMPLADCTEPHLYEVFAQEQSTEDDYPGTDEMTAVGDEFCRETLLSDLPDDVDTDPMVYRTISPSPETWESGDRTLTCIAGVNEGYAITGSFTSGDEVSISAT